MNNEEKKPRMKGPLDFFFKLGDWVTKGDAKKQASFTYYMVWILFLAFVGMFFANMYRVLTGDLYSLIWAGVGFAIASLQFFNLKQMYEMRKLMNNQPKPEPIESVDEMLKSFEEKEKNMKGGESVQK